MDRAALVAQQCAARQLTQSDAGAIWLSSQTNQLRQMQMTKPATSTSATSSAKHRAPRAAAGKSKSKPKALVTLKFKFIGDKAPTLWLLDEDLRFLNRPHAEVKRKGLSVERTFICEVRQPGLYHYRGIKLDASHPLHEHVKANPEGYFRLSGAGQMSAFVPNLPRTQPILSTGTRNLGQSANVCT